ncbi:ankyrin repeat domain-containing protein 26-like [Nannospalax galili]|uniref:ankyrin repeat domain-containing protein 26-like n=1 Tax=Nannospalax galili TaxID=1026970 RepID=UPI0004ED4909|nr:ankyrin repeat domain-containing protein 26-like [Nannospalax galili]
MKKGTHEHQNGGFSVYRDLNMSQTEIHDEKNTLRMQLKTEADRLEEQRRNDSVTSLRTELEGIIKEKESELTKLKSENESAKTELEMYKERYQEQLKFTFYWYSKEKILTRPLSSYRKTVQGCGEYSIQAITQRKLLLKNFRIDSNTAENSKQEQAWVPLCHICDLD